VSFQLASARAAERRSGLAAKQVPAESKLPAGDNRDTKVREDQ